MSILDSDFFKCKNYTYFVRSQGKSDCKICARNNKNGEVTQIICVANKEQAFMLLKAIVFANLVRGVDEPAGEGMEVSFRLESKNNG